MHSRPRDQLNHASRVTRKTRESRVTRESQVIVKCDEHELRLARFNREEFESGVTRDK